jgi:hypothetical protein
MERALLSIVSQAFKLTTYFDEDVTTKEFL